MKHLSFPLLNLLDLPNEILALLFRNYLDMKSCLALADSSLRMRSIIDGDDPMWRDKFDAFLDKYENMAEGFYLCGLALWYYVGTRNEWRWEGEVKTQREGLARGLRMIKVAASERKPKVNHLKLLEKEGDRMKERKVVVSSNYVAFVGLNEGSPELDIQVWKVLEYGTEFELVNQVSVPFVGETLPDMRLFGALLVLDPVNNNSKDKMYHNLMPEDTEGIVELEEIWRELSDSCDSSLNSNSVPNWGSVKHQGAELAHAHEMLLHPFYRERDCDPKIRMGMERSTELCQTSSIVRYTIECLVEGSRTRFVKPYREELNLIANVFYGPHFTLWYGKVNGQLKLFVSPVREFMSDDLGMTVLWETKDEKSRPLTLCNGGDGANNPEWLAFTYACQRELIFVSF